MKEKNKISKFLIVVLVIGIVIGLLCGKTSIWMNRNLQTSTGMGTRAIKLDDTTINLNEPIVQTSNEDFLISGKDIIAQSFKLLGIKYDFGQKGAYNPYGNASIQEAETIKGIDCSGLVYWTLSKLGLTAKGFGFYNPVPVDSDDYLYYKEDGYYHYYREVGKWERIKEDAEWKFTPEDESKKSIYDNKSNLKYVNSNGDACNVNVLKINDPITQDLRYYEYYDSNNVKQVLPEGTIVVSYGKAIGLYNHVWIYIGDLKTSDVTEAKRILENTFNVEIDDNNIYSNGTSTHWRIEASEEKVTINNGDPNRGDISTDASGKVKGIGPIWAFQFGSDYTFNIEGSYTIDINKISEEDGTTLAGATFEVKQEVNRGEKINTYTLESLENGGSRNTENNQSNPPIVTDITATGKGDILTITETNPPAGYEVPSIATVKLRANKKLEAGEYKLKSVTLYEGDKAEDEFYVEETGDFGWDASGNVTTIKENIKIQVSVDGVNNKIEITWSDPKLSGSYDMNIKKISRGDSSQNGIAGVGARFNIQQWLNENTEANDTIDVQTKENAVPIEFKNEDGIKSNKIKINDIGKEDTYSITETNPPAGYGNTPNWNLKMQVYKNVVTVGQEQRYTVEKVTVYKDATEDSEAFSYDVNTEETIRINAEGGLTTDDNYVVEIKLTKNDTENVSINIVWSDPEDDIYDLNLLKKDNNNYSEGETKDSEVKNSVGNVKDVVPGAEYRITKYEKKNEDFLNTLNTCYDSNNWINNNGQEHITTSQELSNVFTEQAMPNYDEKDLFDVYVIEETNTPTGYKSNNVVYLLIVHFEENETISGKVQIGNVEERYLVKEENGNIRRNEDGTTIAIYDSNNPSTGKNSDGSNYEVGKDNDNKYRIDYAKKTIIFTAQDEAVTGTYDVDLAKNGVFNMQYIEGLDSIGTNVPGAVYKVTQYLNVDRKIRADDQYTVYEDFEQENNPDSEITVKTLENGKLQNVRTLEVLDKLYQNVEITDINTVDIYVIEELTAPFGYAKNNNKVYVQISKEEVVDSSTNKKAFAIKVDEGDAYNSCVPQEYDNTNSSFESTKSSVRMFTIYDLTDSNGITRTTINYEDFYRLNNNGDRIVNRDDSRFIYNNNTKFRADYNKNSLVISTTDIEKEGKYDFNILKTDEAGNKIEALEADQAKFNITVYSEEVINENDGTVTYKNKVEGLKDSKEQDINNENIAISEISFEDIEISKEIVGKTYYFVLEEVSAPKGFVPLGYKIVIPVAFYENSNCLASNLLNAAILMKVEGSESYKKEELGDVKVSSKYKGNTNHIGTKLVVDVSIPNTEEKPMFDLALRKSITAIERDGQDLTSEIITENRLPVLNETSLEGLRSEDTTMNYYHTKTAVTVRTGDIVTYTMRIYNENETGGYATEITDYIPEGLEFINSTVNDGWKTITDKNGKVVGITTNCLSKEAETQDGENLIKAIVINEDNTYEIDYKEVQVQLKVVAEQDTQNKAVNYITNRAEITEYGYYNSNNEYQEVNKKGVDIDSVENTIYDETTGIDSVGLGTWYVSHVINNTPAIANYYPGDQDDDDFETVVLEEQVDVKLELNKLGAYDLGNIAGATFNIENITENKDVQIALLNKLTEEELKLNEDGDIVVPEEGIIVKLAGLLRSQKYQIKITEKAAPQEYKKSLDYLVLEVYVDSNGTVHTKVLEINGEQALVSDSQIAVLEGKNEEGNVEIGLGETYNNLTVEYSLDQPDNWQVYTDKITVDKNTVVYARTKTNDGKVSSQAVKVIDNIDKIAPTVSNIELVKSEEEKIASITAKIEDLESEEKVTESLPKYGASGISAYALSVSETEAPNKKTVVNQEKEKQITIENITKSGTYYLWVWDAAGNHTVQPIDVQLNEDIMVARIISVTSSGNNDYTNLEGAEYATLEAALAACPKLGEGTAVIQIINNITNESNVINKNVTIDLDGYTVAAQSTDNGTPTLTVANNAVLTIIDSKTTGQILNNHSDFSNYRGEAIAIVVEEQGTLTLGENDRAIVAASPTVSGMGYGIFNKGSYSGEDWTGGTLNFYDGKVIATKATINNKEVATAIYGKVTDTPVVYSVSVSDQTEPETVQTASLAMITGIEARIGRKTYTKLEDAIADAGTMYGTDGSQVKIVIVADLAKSETIVVDKTKNIMLDLDGHTFTTVRSDGYVLDNYGKLEIVDSSEEQTGKITSTTNDAIHNASTDEYIGDAIDFDLSEVKKYSEDDEYYFQYNPVGKKLVNTNNDHDASPNTSAIGYLELDLTGYEEGRYTLTIDAEISSVYAYGSRGYVSITNDPDNSSRVNSSAYGNLIYLNGNIKSKDYTFDLAGGQKYYLNFRYDKTTRIGYDDEFRINSIKVQKKKAGELTLTSGTIELDIASKSAINNAGIVKMNGGTITGNKNNMRGVTTELGGTTYINGGNIALLSSSKSVAVNALGSRSFTKIIGGNIAGYDGVISSSCLSNVIITGGIFSKECNYHQIYNAGAYSLIKLEGVTIQSNGSCNIINDADYNKIIINNCNLSNSYSNGIIINNNRGTIEVNNTEMNCVRGIYASGNTKINNSNIITTGAYDSIYCYINSVCDIQDSTIISKGNSRAIGTYRGNTLNIKNSTLTNTNSTSNYEAINMGDSGTLNITGNTTITTNGAAIYSNSSNNHTINIESGTLESTKWQAIEMPNSKGTITLGTKGGNVEESPILKSSLTAWTINANNMKLNFYDGKLVGKQDTIIGVPIENLEDGYQLVSTQKEYPDGNNYEEITLGIQNDVAYIVDIDTTYNTLEDAVNACEENKYTIQLLKDVNQVNQIQIGENQNIKIDLNGHKLYAMTDNTFYNKGTLEIVDSVERSEDDYNLISLGGATIVDNALVEAKESSEDGTTTITSNVIIGEGVKIYYTSSKQAINNAANLTIGKATITTTGNLSRAINNVDTGKVEIKEGSIITNGSDTNGVFNTGNLKITGGSITTNRFRIWNT